MSEAEILAALYRLYSDGRKLTVRPCRKCGFVAGFYFQDGLVRYDPGCYCIWPLPQNRPSTEERLREFIHRFPDKAEAWITHRQAELAEWAEYERAQTKLREPTGIHVPKPRRRSMATVKEQGAHRNNITNSIAGEQQKPAEDRRQLEFFTSECAGYCGVLPMTEVGVNREHTGIRLGCGR